MVREPLHLQIHDVRCRTQRITRRQSFLHQVLSLLGRAHHPVAVSQQLTPQPADDTGEILADRHRLLGCPANTSEHADPISTDLAASTIAADSPNPQQPSNTFRAISPGKLSGGSGMRRAWDVQGGDARWTQQRHAARP